MSCTSQRTMPLKSSVRLPSGSMVSTAPVPPETVLNRAYCGACDIAHVPTRQQRLTPPGGPSALMCELGDWFGAGHSTAIVALDGADPLPATATTRPCAPLGGGGTSPRQRG